MTPELEVFLRRKVSLPQLCVWVSTDGPMALQRDGLEPLVFNRGAFSLTWPANREVEGIVRKRLTRSQAGYFG